MSNSIELNNNNFFPDSGNFDEPVTSGRYDDVWIDRGQTGLAAGDAAFRGGSAAPTASLPACPILDTHTRDSAKNRKPFRTDSDRRCYSRVMLGLQQPGRYYFLTLTSSPQSPPIQKGWRAISQWLKREYGRLPWIHVVTSEGCGVIHMVIRLRPRQKNIDIKKVRKFWKKVHKATQVKILRVEESKKEDLANYLSDQRKLKKMGAEMSWQPGIIKWGWSPGWIPQGFTRSFGKFWQSFNQFMVAPGLRDMTLHNWIQKCHKNQKLMKKSGFKIYPCCERPTASEILHAELYDLAGRKVRG